MMAAHKPVRNARAAAAALGGAVLLLAAGGLVGAACGPRAAHEAAASRTASHEAAPHGHAAPHGGVVVTVGDRHHAEAVWEPGAGRRVQVFVLGAEESIPFPIPVPALAATFEGAGGTGAQALTLRARPLPGESAGSFASRFEGVAPSAPGAASALTVTLPLAGEEHRVRFEPRAAADAEGAAGGETHDEGGDAAPTAGERALFFTPGGRYTRADIEANGAAAETPARRYRGMMARHDRFPAIGTRLCPISGTKADARFSWVIGGRRYQFCCPPCIEEFVQQAKQRPETIRPPQDYVKKG